MWFNIPLLDSIENVQPMTGIVYWTTCSHSNSEAISLEFSYMLFNAIVQDSGVYDWGPVEAKLNAVASRGHQAIFRFRFVYPGYQTSVPDYIKSIDDYTETAGLSEGRTTHFPDWSHPELKRFTLEFQERFAQEYDNDPRLAFVQVGFGLWAEYHIYDGPFTLGGTFPSKAFQAEFFHQMDAVWEHVPWSISIDAADPTYSPFSQQTELLDIPFGVFDDSFMHENHASWNLGNWNFFDRERYRYSPAGGEFSYYTSYDQQNVLNPVTGAHGTSYEQWAQDFHISYMFGNDQPGYQTESRIKEASKASGYHFKITAFSANPDSSKLSITNVGVAPIYYDAYPTVNGVRADESLKYLTAGDTLDLEILSGGTAPVLTIECDKLVPGQVIEYEAHLE
ncbi:MAG: DUF4832 domain-containing protein [Candidatus Marinimicrobia bacterium]|nr:DUF4832 domain-containing protein [Candidatus Neomarinimicrobiota bacterium]MCF7921853.1 DUF4832 domain-containing protein [Candidatus Neomarinimicrobiota bacterium]